MKRVSLLMALLMLVVLALSACGTQGPTGPEGGDGPGTGGDVTLEILHFHTPETKDNNVESRGYNAMSDKFIQDNADVTFNVTTLQQADYHTKIMALAAANEMPDIFFTKGSWVQNFYDNDLMADLTDKVDTGLFREGIFTPFTRDGKIYAMPIQFTATSIVYYNEQMFKDIGYDAFPKTWEELLDANEKFKAKNVPMIALGNKDKWPFESCIISTLGDRFTGTDWTQSIILGDGSAKFTDDVFITTLEYSQAMAEEGMFNVDFNAITNEQADNLYGTGKAASTVEGAWTVTYLLTNADEEVLENTQLALLPSVPGQKGSSKATSGGAGWSQSVSAKLTGEALEMAIAYNLATTGVEYSQYLMDDSGILAQCEVPVTDKESLPLLSQRYLDFIGTLELVPIYDIQMDGAVIDVMNSKLQELLNGTITPQDVADAIQVEQDKVQQ